MSLQSFAAVTNFVMTFTTPLKPGGSYAGNCVAVWVTKTDNTFVKTICRWAQTRKADLTTWNVNGKLDSDTLYVDGKMGATRSNINTPNPVRTIGWDLKDRAGNVIPDGTYNINFEMTDGTRKNYSGTFVKDSTSGTRTIADNAYFASINITYIPIVTVTTATVTFDAQSGTASSPTSTTVTNGLTYGTLATTTRAGYIFAGWWTGTGGTGTQVTPSTTVTITSAQTLYANWTVNAISTVTFDGQGGITPIPMTTIVTNGLTY